MELADKSELQNYEDVLSLMTSDPAANMLLALSQDEQDEADEICALSVHLPRI